MQKILRTTGLFVLLPMIAFFLAACGGGGGDSAPDLSPAVTTSPATSVTNNSAILNAVVNPKGLSTTALFEYSKDSGFATITSTTIQLLGSGSADNLITQSITGLDQGTNYYFRVKATNSAGSRTGLAVAFSTLPLPAATTNPATSITTSGATLNAIVNPNGRATDAWFEYGTTTSFGSILDNASRGSGTDNVTINAALAGLLPAKQYFFRIVANSSAGTSVGSTLDFTTAGGVPLVVTKSATSVTDNGATLNADVNPSGLATNAWFEWSTDNTFASSTTTDNLAKGSGTANVAHTYILSGQAMGTKIYYRVAASNAVGPSLKGDTFNFTTLNPPPIANAGDNQTVFQGRTVTLNGTGSSPNGSGSITYLWTQTAGPSVTLSGSTTANPTFTAPQLHVPSPNVPPPNVVLTFGLTVTSSRVPTPPTATDNVNVTVKYGFFDDFSTDTITAGSYIDNQTPSGGGSTFTYNAGFAAASVITGTGKALQFRRDLGFGIAGADTIDAGVFSLIFFPTGAAHAAGNGIIIRLGEVDSITYYEISTIDNTARKVFGGVMDISTPFPSASTFAPDTGYLLKIRFSPSLTTFEIDGTTVATLSGGAENSISAFDFTVETRNMDAFYDDIKLEAP